jgi:zinc protease
MRTPLLRATIVCATALFVFSACSRQERPRSVDRELPNGVRILARENRASEIVSLHLWVRDGALYETPDEAGLANLLSRLMYTETTSHPLGEIKESVARLGGQMTVNSRHDFVEYATIVPSTGFEPAADLVVDGLENAVFDSARFEAARSKLIQDIAGMWRRPVDRAQLLCLHEILGDHPYGRPAYGTAEAARGFSLGQVRRRYVERYVGSNLLVVADGDVDPVKAAGVLEDLLSGLKKGLPAEPAAPPVVWPTRSSRVVERADVPSAYEVMCYPGPGIRDPDAIAMDILLVVLRGGKSSRAVRVLEDERDLVTSVDAGWYTLRQPSPLTFVMELPPGNVEAAEKAVTDIVRGLVESPVSEGELAKAKAYWETQVLLMNETAQGQGFYQGYWTFLGWPGLPEEYIESLDRVTAEDVQRAARDYFGAGVHATAVVLPRWAD